MMQTWFASWRGDGTLRTKAMLLPSGENTQASDRGAATTDRLGGLFSQDWRALPPDGTGSPREKFQALEELARSGLEGKP